ncbi:nuclear transport factor 2 family protein [Streptomyces fagopyri]|uniref:nuclear transport factor 2 family protein n=1 Tax=Streptomyces fagopyri TaxID=2662397 RepID=UPI0037FDB11A
MSTLQEKNKAIVREAFDTLFNQRDYTAAEKFWSPDYIQHSAHIAPGREGLFELIKSLPAELTHELDLVMADGDMVMVRGRFSGHGLPAPWIAADFVRMHNGVLVEHWDIIEDEVSRAASVSGLPMYGDTFPEER